MNKKWRQKILQQFCENKQQIQSKRPGLTWFSGISLELSVMSKIGDHLSINEAWEVYNKLKESGVENPFDQLTNSQNLAITASYAMWFTFIFLTHGKVGKAVVANTLAGVKALDQAIPRSMQIPSGPSKENKL